MTTMTTEVRVQQLLSRMLDRPIDQLTLDANLVQELGIDSVDLLGLVSGLEEEFDLVFPGDGAPIAQVRTIRELAALVDETLSG